MKRLLKDIIAAVSGILVIGRYCFSEDNVSVAISWFASRAAVARAGERNQYIVVLANTTSRHCWVRLRVDIHLQSNPTHPDGHLAYFQKRIFLRKRDSQRVEVDYDWQEEVTFHIEGVRLAPDTVWSGPCRIAGTYLVRAGLFVDDGEKPYEELTVLQRFRENP